VKAARWGSRYFLLSVLLSVGAFALSWVTSDLSAFTAIGTVALGGGHLTNVMERKALAPPPPPPEAS